MDVEMADVKDEHQEHQEQHQHQQEQEQEQEQQHIESEQLVEHVEHAEHQEDSSAEHLPEEEHSQLQADQEVVSGDQEAQQYDQQYDASYVQQYETGEEGQPGEELYETQAAVEGEYDQDGNAVAYDVAVDAAAAVASAAAAAAAPSEQEYVDQQQAEAGQEYVDQQQGDSGQGYADQQHDDGQGYVDDPNAQQVYADQEVIDGQQHPDEQGDQQGDMDEQTLASHPATSREMQVAEAMVVDGGHGTHSITSEVSQAIGRFEYASSNPDGLQTLAATSSAVTQHGANSIVTPSHSQPHHALGSSMGHMYHNQKPLTPKFNRARNWTRDETKLMLSELERIVNENPEDRREVVLRAHPTFDQTASVLRSAGYNRDGQGCMIRWRNLLRVYKQQRVAAAEGDPSQQHQNLQYATEIESIYRFPPDGIQGYHMPGDSGSPGIEGTPSSHPRTWSQANGSSYETPARKRAREMNMMTDHIERMDQKLDQALDIISQQSEVLRSVEERLARTEEALKHSEATIETLNTTIGEKDAKRDELEKQLMVTVQALSQVIAAKKSEQ